MACSFGIKQQSLAHYDMYNNCDFFFQGIESTVATAGFSVGEFAAMVFAEVMSFEDGEIIYILKRNLWKSTFFKI